MLIDGFEGCAEVLSQRNVHLFKALKLHDKQSFVTLTVTE